MAEQRQHGNLAPSQQGEYDQGGEESFVRDWQRYCELRKELEQLKQQLGPQISRISAEFEHGGQMTPEEFEQPQAQGTHQPRPQAPRPAQAPRPGGRGHS